jgi:hypothetical protein
MSDQSETRPPVAATANDGPTTQPGLEGLELPFVQPKTYLQPENRAPVMLSHPQSPLDKEQMQGLVSSTCPARACDNALSEALEQLHTWSQMNKADLR